MKCESRPFLITSDSKEQRNQDSRREAEAICGQALAKGSCQPSGPFPSPPGKKQIGADLHRPLHPAAKRTGTTRHHSTSGCKCSEQATVLLFETAGADSHSAQFESQMMAKLGKLWNVGKTHPTHTTHRHRE